MTRIFLFISAPLVLVVLVFAIYAGLNRQGPDGSAGANQRQQAPAVRTIALGNKPSFDDQTLRQPGAKIVNYWASWCIPCRVEHPNLQALADEGVPIYGVNYKNKPALGLAFLKELGDPYRAIVADESGLMAQGWGIAGLPTTFIIDGNGGIVLRFVGPITRKILDSTIRPALARAN